MSNFGFDEAGKFPLEDRLDAILAAMNEDDVPFLVAAVRHMRKQRDELAGHLSAALNKNPHLNREVLEQAAEKLLVGIFPNRAGAETMRAAVKSELERDTGQWQSFPAGCTVEYSPPVLSAADLEKLMGVILDFKVLLVNTPCAAASKDADECQAILEAYRKAVETVPVVQQPRLSDVLLARDAAMPQKPMQVTLLPVEAWRLPRGTAMFPTVEGWREAQPGERTCYCLAEYFDGSTAEPDEDGIYRVLVRRMTADEMENGVRAFTEGELAACIDPNIQPLFPGNVLETSSSGAVQTPWEVTFHGLSFADHSLAGSVVDATPEPAPDVVVKAEVKS